MKVIFMLALLIGSLVVSNAFRLPFQLFDSNENYNNGLSKRNYYETKPYKREFNAEDLTLRFGKRGGVGETLAFSPDMLSLRFGKK